MRVPDRAGPRPLTVDGLKVNRGNQMKRVVLAGVTAAGSLALIGGVLVAGGGAALAASTTNRAWGAGATGTIMLSPVAVATPTFTPAVAPNANIAGLLSTSTIVDRADSAGAWSRVEAGMVLRLPGQGWLTSSGVRSWCTVGTSGDVSGGATIVAGSVTQLGRSIVPLSHKPAPNTVIMLAGGSGTITLNYQRTTRGVHTFEAVHAVLGGQAVDLGVSECYVAPVG